MTRWFLILVLLTTPAYGQMMVSRRAMSAAAAVCGNSVRDGSEQCDGSDLGTGSCSNQGFGCGTLACKSDGSCTYDSSGCTLCALPDAFGCDSTSCFSQDYGTWTVGSGVLSHAVGGYAIDLLRYTYGTISSASQCGRLKFDAWTGTSATPNIYTGIFLRAGSVNTDAKYAIWARPDNNRVQWAYVTGQTKTQIDVTSSCGGVTFAAGDVFCARVTGTQGGTVVDVWKGDGSSCVGTDYTTWGAADCSLTADPSIPVDSGAYGGVAIDSSGASNETTTVDDVNVWSCP